MRAVGWRLDGRRAAPATLASAELSALADALPLVPALSLPTASRVELSLAPALALTLEFQPESHKAKGSGIIA